MNERQMNKRVLTRQEPTRKNKIRSLARGLLRRLAPRRSYMSREPGAASGGQSACLGRIISTPQISEWTPSKIALVSSQCIREVASRSEARIRPAPGG